MVESVPTETPCSWGNAQRIAVSGGLIKRLKRKENRTVRCGTANVQLAQACASNVDQTSSGRMPVM